METLIWIIDSLSLFAAFGMIAGYFVDKHYAKTRVHLFGPRLYGPSWRPFFWFFRSYVRRVRAFHDRIDQEDDRYRRGDGYDVVIRDSVPACTACTAASELSSATASRYDELILARLARLSCICGRHWLPNADALFRLDNYPSPENDRG